MSFHRAASAAGILFLLLDAATAHASSPAESPSCSARLHGGWLPANAPALLVDERYYETTGSLAASLVPANGATAIPLGAPYVDAQELHALPLPPLPVGSYVLDAKQTCSGPAQYISPVELEIRAAVPFPTRVGTLTATMRNDQTLDVKLAPTDGLVAFLPISSLRLRVDGTTTPGELDEARGLSNDGSSIEIEKRLTLQAYLTVACLRDGLYLATKETAHISLDVAIAGAATMPEPATLDVPVDCNAVNGPDAGRTYDEAHDYGCAAGIGHSPAGFAPASALALLALGACAVDAHVPDLGARATTTGSRTIRRGWFDRSTRPSSSSSSASTSSSRSSRTRSGRSSPRSSRRSGSR